MPTTHFQKCEHALFMCLIGFFRTSGKDPLENASLGRDVYQRGGGGFSEIFMGHFLG